MVLLDITQRPEVKLVKMVSEGIIPLKAMARSSSTVYEENPWREQH